jgi:hypothetical protein
LLAKSFVKTGKRQKKRKYLELHWFTGHTGEPSWVFSFKNRHGGARLAEHNAFGYRR